MMKNSRSILFDFIILGAVIYHIETYTGVDFRKYPERYRIGIGEQGVLMAEPYKSEILPHWRFKTPEIAKESSEKIYSMFLDYLKKEEFVGADMSLKYLRMGWTRARRYANHPSGTKYNDKKEVMAQAKDWKTSQKAQSAQIFKDIYDKARIDSHYLSQKEKHQKLFAEHNQ